MSISHCAADGGNHPPILLTNCASHMPANTGEREGRPCRSLRRGSAARFDGLDLCHVASPFRRRCKVLNGCGVILSRGFHPGSVTWTRPPAIRLGQPLRVLNAELRGRQTLVPRASTGIDAGYPVERPVTGEHSSIVLIRREMSSTKAP